MEITIERLLEGNKQFVSNKLRENSSIFKDTSQSQHPKFLWVG